MNYSDNEIDNMTLGKTLDLDLFLVEAQESFMCDVIKIRLKRRIATRSGKENHQLNINTAAERPILDEAFFI